MPEEPKGDISIFGAQQQVHESDSSLDAIEQEQHGGTAQDEQQWDDPQPYQAGPPEMDISMEDEAEAEDGEDEEEGVDEYAQALRRFRGGETEPTPDPDDDQIAQRLAYQQGRLEALEEQIRQRAATPAQPEVEPEPQKPKGSGINYSDPAIQAAIAAAVDDPAKLGPTIAVLARKEAEALIQSEVGEVKETLEQIRAREADSQERTKVNAGITAGLQAAYQMGGLEAAIVKEAYELQNDSLLFQYLGNGNQALATTPQGIMTAVLAVARAVERADTEGSEDKPTKEAPAPVSGQKRTTSASKRGRKLNQPKQKASAEEEERSRIVGVKRQSSNIPFMQ